MGQPIMPEIWESTQPLTRNLATFSSQIEPHGLFAAISHLRGIGERNHLAKRPTAAVLPTAIAATVPHAVGLIIVSIVVTGLVGVVSRYLFFYARNSRARSITAIRKAAIRGKIAVSDAERLIRADMPVNADQQAPDETPGTGGQARGGDDSNALGSVTQRKPPRFIGRPL